MIDNNLWKPFGITDPVKELAAHPNPTMQVMSRIAESMALIHSDLGAYFAGSMLMSYNAGVSEGRLAALKNPLKAFQDEVASLKLPEAI
jgi:hypothetical protein